jgi:bacillithiol biosynthesis cysteine-adding enzyme BshC
MWLFYHTGHYGWNNKDINFLQHRVSGLAAAPSVPRDASVTLNKRMECTCVRQTDLPGTTRLFADLIYHPDRTAAFYSSPKTFAEAAAQIDFPDDRRSALVAALRQINGPSAQLDLLARPGTVAVVTGQQVGLFSGPAYTLYKALSAVKLARELTADGIPAVPVFWLATEDHDLAEVNHAWVFNSAPEPVQLSVAPPARPNQPVGTIALPTPPVAELRATLAGLPFADEVLELVACSYHPGFTMGKAFLDLVRGLLQSYEVLFIDPMSPAVRDLGAPMIRQALEAAPELSSALLRRNKELEQAGYHAQVHFEESTSLFFLLDEGERLALRRTKDEYVHQARRFTVAELQSRAHEVSPNALLRPVVQDFMLPTIAYIGGPAELAYLAQSQVIYDRLLGRQPVPLPRAGFTVLDSHSTKLMARYHLGIPDFASGELSLREKVAEQLVSPELTALMAETRTGMARSLATLKSRLIGFDSTLAKALNRSTRKIEYQLQKIESKIARQTLIRDERASHDASALANLVFPHKHLQERFYSILPLMAKHGPGLVDTIYENIHLDCPDHKLLTL